MTKLFTPITLGGKKNPIHLQHRIAMAPLTRLRAGDPGVQPEYAATYYAQRTTPGGLIVAEATNMAAEGRGYYGSPGIFNHDQIKAWKPITKAVHDKGGVIFLQLWHTGRIGHPLNMPNGELCQSSSAKMPMTENRLVPTKEGRLPLVLPRALRTDELPRLCELYRVASVNAIEAGFDGVEVHSANGYLLEQFLHDGINDRTDEYGGSIENRARLLFEVLDAILTSLPSSQVSFRISPFGKSCGQFDSNPIATYSYILEKANALDLAYVHLIEPRGFHYPNDLCPIEGAASLFRKVYKGILMTASGYDRESSVDVVEQGSADMVAIGRYFISNPDLVERFRLNAHLTPYDSSSFNSSGPDGYTTYLTLKEEQTQIN